MVSAKLVEKGNDPDTFQSYSVWQVGCYRSIFVWRRPLSGVSNWVRKGYWLDREGYKPNGSVESMDIAVLKGLQRIQQEIDLQNNKAAADKLWEKP